MQFAHGEVILHKNVPSRRADFMRAFAPFRDGLGGGGECMFAWYWLADLCDEHVMWPAGSTLHHRRKDVLIDYLERLLHFWEESVVLARKYGD